MSQTEATIIARNTFIKGDLKIEGAAIIAGHVEGSILAEEIEIAQEGRVEGDIHAAVIDVHGMVKGNITATRACRLGATASADGGLKAATLSIAEGASFVGQVIVGRDEQALPEPESESKDAAVEEVAAVAAVTHTINRLETLAAQVDNAVRTSHMTAPTPTLAGTAPIPQVAEIRVFPQTVQNLNRAPRIIKAR